MNSGGCGSEHCCQQNPNPVIKEKSSCKNDETKTTDGAIEDLQNIEVYNNKHVFGRFIKHFKFIYTTFVLLQNLSDI